MHDVPRERLDNVVSLVTDKILTRKDPTLPYVGLEHIPSGGSRVLGVASSAESVSANTIFRCGDTLFGKLRPRLRKAVPVEFDGYCSTDVLVLRAKAPVHPAFASFVLRSDDVFVQAVRAEEGTKMPRCSWRAVKNVKVFCPDPAEQAAIAEVLSTLDDVIADTAALISKMRQVKTGVMHDLFSRGVTLDGRLRPTRAEAPHLYKESSLGWLPTDWDDELLDRVAVRGSGHTPSKSEPAFWNGGLKWISLADTFRLDRVYISQTEKTISADGIANSSAVLHPPGVVVLSRDAGVGKSAVTTEPMAVSQHFVCWRCNRGLDNLYLYYWLQKDKRHFENIATGTTIPTIGLGFFKRYKIAVPRDVREQVRISAALSAIDEQLFEREREIEKLHSLRKGLMQDLLTGRVRLHA